MNKIKIRWATILAAVVGMLLMSGLSLTAWAERPADDDAQQPAQARNGSSEEAVVPEPHQAGGESAGVVRVANLVYAGTKSSECFSDAFLAQAEKDSTISTSRRLHTVKLSSEELFEYPLIIMTGEGEFTLPDAERQNLRAYVESGGLLLASAGCSSPEWDRSFRSEMAQVFPELKLEELGMDHAVFNTVHEITELKAKHGTPKPLQGLHYNDRLSVLYAPDGLNDTANTTGCCCCGGNEITNANQVNVNILAYALLY